MARLKLGVDEASISINGAASKLAGEPILVLYQVDECFGCPLDEVKRLDGNDQTVILGTKHSIDLELRQIHRKLNQTHDGSSLVCRLAKLSLNSQARYRINIQDAANTSTVFPPGFECDLQTTELGECSYCPVALLFFILFFVTIVEELYRKFAGRNRQRDTATTSNSRPSIKSAATFIGTSQKNQPDSSGADTGGGDGALSADEQTGSGSRAEESSQMVTVPMERPESNQQSSPYRDDVEDSERPVLTVARGGAEEKSSTGEKDKIVRIESLDAFRGLTIAGMIVVNYGGAGYRLLEHQPWDGLTPADMVFPFFIFSMGASIALSTKSLVKRGKGPLEILTKIVRRATTLMLLGLFLNSRRLNVRTDSLDGLRLTGVLQRFSISYLAVASMYAVKLTVIKWIKAQSLYRVPLVPRLVGVVFEYLTALNYLAIYLYVTFFLNYSESCPAGYLGPGGMTENGIYANCTGGAAAWLDRVVLGTKHLYQDQGLMRMFKTKQTHDPEGLLGITTSILLTLIGLQCGKIFAKSYRQNNNTHKTRLLGFLKWELILGLISVSALIIPINKRLWSLSFVGITALSAFVMITLLYSLLDIYNCRRTFLLRILISAGKNPIFIYVGHSLLSGMLPWQFYVDESSRLELLLRLSWSTLCWLLIAHYMASKRLIIRV